MRTILAALVLAVTAASALAAPPAKARKAARAVSPKKAVFLSSAPAVHELFEVSGARRETERVLQFIAENPDSLLKVEDPKTGDAYRSISRELLARDKLLPLVEESVRARLSTKSLEEAVKWWKSPPGRKVAELEAKASTPEAQQEQEKFAKSLETSPAAPDRDALVRDYDKASGGAEFSAKLFASCASALVTAPEMSGGRKRNAGEASALREQMEGQMREQVATDQHVEALFTYRAMSDAELRELVAFLRSESGRQAREAFEAGLVETIAGGCGSLGSRLGARVPPAADEAGK